VAECTGDNVFMVKKIGKGQTVKNYILLTPPTYLGALKGITRQAILEIAERIKLPFEERIITRHDLFNANEVFLTGTAAEVIPVVKIDGRGIGDGKPGKITNMLLKDFQALTHKDGVRYTL
jgi:branched-chain amino acid aminotransferase